MAAVDGIYEELELPQIDDATYEDLAKTKEKDLLILLHSDRRRYKRALVGAGLLCAVLVLLNIAVPLYLYQSNMVGRDQWKNNTLTEDTFEQLMTRYNQLTEEKEQLKNSFDQLQNRHSQLTEQKDNIQTDHNKLTKQKEQLQTNFNQLQNRHNQLTEEKDDLQTDVNTLTKQKEQIQASFDQLQNIHNQLTEEKGQLQNSFDQLQSRHNQLTEQKDELQTSFDQLKKTCDEPTCQVQCESGWQKRGSSCYYISTWELNWENSRQWCIAKQSNLIVINSKEEQDFVASFNKRIWLGLTDRDQEGSFQWVDGTLLTTPTYWLPGEPCGVTAEDDCVEYYDGSQSHAPSRGWNVITCSGHATNWICERAVC